MNRPISAITAGVVMAVVGNTSHAQLIDQQNSAPMNIGSAFEAHAPTGQLFTPSLGSLDFFKFNLQDINRNNGLGATFQVRIYQGIGFTGPLLGISSSVAIPDNFGGTDFPGADLVFSFSTPVSLVPNAAYSAELFRVSGDNFADFGNQPGGYAGGTAIYDGTIFSTMDDYFFQEGLTTVPEPSSLLLVAATATAGIVVCQRKRFTARGGNPRAPAAPRRFPPGAASTGPSPAG
jgi:hypothetical protein